MEWAKSQVTGRLTAQRIFALLLIIIGGMLGWLGVQLVAAGGSAYYLIAALMTLGSAALAANSLPAASTVLEIAHRCLYGFRTEQ